MSTYEDFQAQTASEKIALVKMNASVRLIGFEVHSGTVYKLNNFDFSKLESVKDSGVGLTEVFGLTDVVPGAFFNDRTNKILYLETSDSTHPNGKFLVSEFPNFFSNVPVRASHDLSTGFEVYWEPFVVKISGFGVQLDNEDQIGFALEGSGSVVFGNDSNYWDERYERYTWENQDVEVYSWTRDIPISEAKPRYIPISEAKLLFKGIVNGKSWSTNRINFRLKDQLKKLRRTFPLKNIEDVAGALVPANLNLAKQRRVYGRLNGFVPTNIDQVVEGYLLSGTVSLTAGSKTITGVGTAFRSNFSPDDKIILTSSPANIEFTIESIASDTSLTITEAAAGDFSGVAYFINPEQPKSYINREWVVAGNACSHPLRTVVNADGPNRLTLDSVVDLIVGDEVFIGATGVGEVKTLSKVFSDNRVELQTNLELPATVGTEVLRFAVQNLKINNLKLFYDRDYVVTVSPTETRITLDVDAEKNVNPVRTINGSVTFNATTAVTGTGTNFKSQLEPGQHIRSVGEVDFFQIMSIESDTALTLVSAATYSATAAGQYKGGTSFNPKEDVLSCTVIGTTFDNTAEGALLTTCGSIVKDILAESGIGNLNLASFLDADLRAPYLLGFAIPVAFNETTVDPVRDIINQINVSVFGSLVQNEDFELEYNVLRPNRPLTAPTLLKHDVIKIKIESDNDRIVDTVLVDYDAKEHDGASDGPNMSCYSKVSNSGLYLTRIDEQRTIATVLINQDDARILANRWSFLLELATNVIKIETKMQASRFQVNDVILIDHPKLFGRVGGGSRRYAAVQSISKTESGVQLELDDLSNAYNRIGVITENDVPVFANSNEAQKAQNGFITDEYGLIENGNFGVNLIW